MRANTLVSTSTEPVRTHSGKKPWAVASRVNSRGATGSPLKITEVTPPAFILAMVLAADSWMVAGASA